MNVKKFTEWRETDGYKKLTKDSFVIIHDDLVNEPSLGLNFWSERDIPDEWLKQNQKEYPDMNIRRVKVSDIINSDNPEFSHIKSVLLNELNK